tara:strand:- start:361 stop:492 length:132 start_codon:yes stop_codon:yes gene_type:complete
MVMVEAKANKRANVLRRVKHFCKEFGFKSAILNGVFAEGRRKT